MSVTSNLLIFFFSSFLLSLTTSHVIDISSDDVTTQLPLVGGRGGGERNQEVAEVTLSPAGIQGNGNDGPQNVPKVNENPDDLSSSSLPGSSLAPSSSSISLSSFQPSPPSPSSSNSLPPLPLSISSTPGPSSSVVTESVTTTTITAAPSSSSSSSPSSSTTTVQTPSTSLNNLESNSSSTTTKPLSGITGQPTVTSTTTRPRPVSSNPVKPLPTFPVPLAKDPIGVKLYLYTRFHSHAPYMLDANSIDSLKGAYFTFSYTGPNAATVKERAKNRKLYIVIHGLQDGIDITPWMRVMKTRLLDVDRDSNVVLVDWSRGAAVSMLNDLRFASVRIVGQQTVQLIKGLVALYPESFSPENVHIIAHSFGTFAADVAGRNIQNLGRITGLDPAGGVSNIANLPVSQRLDPSDAKFVDIIHTDAPKPANAPLGLNASPLPQLSLPGSSLLSRPAAAAAAVSASGTSIPMGHFDFYPNGGYAQPGCNSLATSPAASILRPLLPAAGAGAANLKKLLTCSHSRAIDLFIESIRHRDSPGCSLLSYSCSNYTSFLDARCTLCKDQEGSASDPNQSTCALMGYNSVDHYFPGDSVGKQFYVTTNSRAPYCLYHYGVAAKIAKKPKVSSRGGVLLVNLDGEYVSSASSPDLEVKIIGGLNGFKPGKTVRAIFTHFADIGAIKSATVSWVPAPPNIATLFSPSTAPALHVQALKVYPMSFAEPQTRKTISRSLCPPPTGFTSLSSLLSGGDKSFSVSRNDPPIATLSAFFKEVTFNPNRCSHHNIHFRSEEEAQDEIEPFTVNSTIPL